MISELCELEIKSHFLKLACNHGSVMEVGQQCFIYVDIVSLPNKVRKGTII